jgi:hypothetical protein
MPGKLAITGEFMRKKRSRKTEEDLIRATQGWVGDIPAE